MQLLLFATSCLALRERAHWLPVMVMSCYNKLRFTRISNMMNIVVSPRRGEIGLHGHHNSARHDFSSDFGILDVIF